MNTRSTSFRDLSFNRLFCDYCEQNPTALSFFEHNPFDAQSLVNVVSKEYPSYNTAKLRDALIAYNNPLSASSESNDNIHALCNDPQTRTVVTGQQLGMAGGPLFTIYKIITAITTARNLTNSTGRKVVPVFWLADEDHDFDEITEVAFPSGTQWFSDRLQQRENPGRRVSEYVVSDSDAAMLDSIEAALPPTDHRPELMDVLRNSYKVGLTHGQAFSDLISSLFGRFGLVIFGSAKPESRLLITDDIIQLVDSSDKIFEALEASSVSLEAEYHRQAAVTHSNWFLIGKNGERIKLQFENGRWTTPQGHDYSTDELKEIIRENPSIVSPNVFMRPILQDRLLPNVAYVAGPGEVAYYAQMKSMYTVLGMKMPVIIPRFSATLYEPSIRKFADELGFAQSEYANRIEDLEASYLRKHEELDINGFFESWSTQISQLAQSKVEQVTQTDPTLEGTLKKIESDQINLLNQLKGKMQKAIKSREEVQLKRISRVQLALYPNRQLQERAVSFIYILNKYGVSFIDELIEVSSGLSTKSHYLVDL